MPMDVRRGSSAIEDEEKEKETIKTSGVDNMTSRESQTILYVHGGACQWNYAYRVGMRGCDVHAMVATWGTYMRGGIISGSRR